MTAGDRLFINLRHIKSGIVGVLLVVFATAVGVALAASTSAFIRAYREQTKSLLNNPVYREIRVTVPEFGSGKIDAPVVETNLEDAKGGFFTVADMMAAVDGSPEVNNAYIVERFEIVTSGALMKEEQSKGGDGKVDRETKPGTEASGKEADLAVDRSDVIFELPVDRFPAIRTTAGFFDAYGMSASDGFLFTEADLSAGNLVIVLGSDLAQTLFPDGGAVGSRVSLYYQTFTIAGVLEPTSLADVTDMTRYNEMAYIPQANLETAWGKRVGITDMRFTTVDSSDVRAAVNQLTAHFLITHPTSDVIVTDALEELREKRQTLSRVIAVLVFLSAVGLFIAAINLLNLMLIRIIKHTKGIGIMRALGTTRSEIFRLFTGESVLMCGVGAIIGAIVSPLVFRLLQTVIVSGEGFASQTFGLDLIIGAVVGFLFSAAFGLYPAVVAKNSDTTLALRAE